MALPFLHQRPTQLELTLTYKFIMMNSYIKSIIYSWAILSMTLIQSCQKQDEFLSEKPSQALAIPSTLRDLQLLLHNESIFNVQVGPALGNISVDDYYVPDDILSGRTTTEQNIYTFKRTLYANEGVPEWTKQYQQIYYANTVLEKLNEIKPETPNLEAYNEVKGQALFYRSYALFNLLQTFSMPYDPSSATTMLGIPLRLTSDLNVKIKRSTIQECLNQILNDLTSALDLVPLSSKYKTSPCKAAVNAMLSRVYLSIGDYLNTMKFATNCLTQYSTLVDYNTLENSVYTFTSNGTYFINEDLYHCTIYNYGINGFTASVVDSSLYKLYEPSDLRKTFFFTVYRDRVRFKGNYELANFGQLYGGLATDEVFLNRAEAYARLGRVNEAMDDLNKLLRSRYQSGQFIPRTAGNVESALDQIILERRKELCYRGIRWLDLRRLNREARFATTLTRTVNGNVFTLPANDPRYAMPLPDAEVSLSGLEQNQR